MNAAKMQMEGPLVGIEGVGPGDLTLVSQSEKGTNSGELDMKPITEK